jgi:hypothetical protein
MYRCSVMYEMYTDKVTVNFSWKKHMDSDAVLGCMLAMLAWQHFEKQKRNKSCASLILYMLEYRKTDQIKWIVSQLLHW